jgi:two-component system phosphate regulon sensor histidine kinase PhoR
LSQLRASFISSVSHDLKTPLAGIRLYSDMLLEKPHFAEPDRRDFYERIRKEATRLTHLVDRVLEFSRMERGDRPYELSECDLAVTIATVVDTYAAHWQTGGFEIRTHFGREIPPVQHDPEAVAAAVVNLLENAVKYSGDSKLIEVRLAVHGNHVFLDVQDHGIGIPQHELHRIFEQYYRGRDVGATGGSGLGLYLVQHVMTGHGGCIEVESQPGRGSTFKLVFPTL